MRTKTGFFIKIQNIAASLRLACVIGLLLFTLPQAAFGETAQTAPLPANVQEFLKLLGNNDVQQWLKKQQEPAGGTEKPKLLPSEGSFGQAFSERLAAIRAHLRDLWNVLPRMGAELAGATERLRASSGGTGFLAIFITTGVLAGLGLAAQAIVKRWFKTDFPLNGEKESLGRHRRRLLMRSIVREVGGIFAFCLACFAPLLFFERAPMADPILLTFLAACAGWVLVRGVLHVFSSLAEDDADTEEEDAPLSGNLFWLLVAAGWFAFGTAITEAAQLTGMDPLVSELVSYVLGLGLLFIGFLLIWRSPWMDVWLGAKAANGNALPRWAATFLLIALWFIWVAGAMRLFWLIAVALSTPVALRAARKLTRHLFPDEREEPEDQRSSTSVVLMDTLTRASLIGLALWFLASVWDIRFSQLAASDDPISKLTRAFVIVLAILFVFDLLWQFTRLAIDVKIARVDEAGSASDAGVRQARLRTLLPVLRNFAMVLFATLAVLMTLSTLGIEIGPLIASAGVVGLAIGFGAQTLVKDIISGIFYLLDDAFRVGEYIQSGNYSGTVESFSLRSVRLRHQNGPVYTVPFSALGAVQNGSRDYAIDKLLITVTYDTDLEKARKLIKQVGEEMMDDPELAPMIIEPLKMNAVADFGTYGIQLKLKSTTKPGFQSSVRNLAYPMIKKAFDENGIEFAHPTVKVSEGDSKASAAALQQVLNADQAAISSN